MIDEGKRGNKIKKKIKKELSTIDEEPGAYR